jgi:hypothetical protein
VSRLRHGCSSRSLRISPLHREFHSPLLPSSATVTNDPPRLSRGLSRRSYRAACARFTPSNSGQRSTPTYYRGCWHVVSRAFFLRYCQYSSLRKGVYTPKSVIPHAALLRQAFAHCGKFLAAASRRSGDRVSVPLWLAVLSDQLRIIALVSRYPANKLIRRRLLPGWLAPFLGDP